MPNKKKELYKKIILVYFNGVQDPMGNSICSYHGVKYSRKNKTEIKQGEKNYYE